MKTTMWTCLLLAAVPAVMLTGCSSENDDHGSTPSPSATESTATNTPAMGASADPSGPVTEEEARKSDRYGSFGAPSASADGQHGGDDLSDEQQKDAEDLAKKTITAWISDHSDAQQWRERLIPGASGTFAQQVSMTDPSLIEEGEVTGLGQTETGTGAVTVTVTTTTGDYRVIIRQGSEGLVVDGVSAAWRDRK